MCIINIKKNYIDIQLCITISIKMFDLTITILKVLQIRIYDWMSI